MNAKPRIVVAMSGGVDSSVAAGVLRDAGWEVVGVTLRVLSGAEDGGGSAGANARPCCAPRDLEDAWHVQDAQHVRDAKHIQDAQRVADLLGVEHHVVDAREEFQASVVEPFVEAYRSGRTPLPCAACNHAVKFGLLLARAAAIGAAGVATGHYARIERGNGGAKLRRARDEERDQSYFLYGLARDRLARIHFPLGEMTKKEVRARARAWGLPVAEKPDSQEVCFIPDGDTVAFLDGRLGESPGPIVDSEGRAMGEHRGLHRFTVGQRRGLGLGGPAPVCVLALRPGTNTVVVGPEDRLYAAGFVARDANLLADGWPERGVTVRIRSRHAPAACTIGPEPDGRLRVVLAEPQRAVTPGQAAVFYRGDEVLGGGTIDTVP